MPYPSRRRQPPGVGVCRVIDDLLSEITKHLAMTAMQTAEQGGGVREMVALVTPEDRHSVTVIFPRYPRQKTGEVRLAVAALANLLNTRAAVWLADAYISEYVDRKWDGTRPKDDPAAREALMLLVAKQEEEAVDVMAFRCFYSRRDDGTLEWEDPTTEEGMKGDVVDALCTMVASHTEFKADEAEDVLAEMRRMGFLFIWHRLDGSIQVDPPE